MVVGEDEDRMPEGRLVTPPCVGVWVVLPWARSAAEHSPAHDRGARCLGRFLESLRVRVALAALYAVRLAPARQLHDPLVQLLAALAERLLKRRVWPSDVAV